MPSSSTTSTASPVPSIYFLSQEGTKKVSHILYNALTQGTTKDKVIPALFVLSGTTSIASGIYASHENFPAKVVASLCASGLMSYTLTITFNLIERLKTYVNKHDSSLGENKQIIQSVIKYLEFFRTSIFTSIAAIPAGTAIDSLTNVQDNDIVKNILALTSATGAITVGALLQKIDNISRNPVDNNTFDVKTLLNMAITAFATVGTAIATSGIYRVATQQNKALPSATIINGLLILCISARLMYITSKAPVAQISEEGAATEETPLLAGTPEAV